MYWVTQIFLGITFIIITTVGTAKEALLMDTEHGDALQKLRILEDSSRYSKSTVEETIITQAPT